QNGSLPATCRGWVRSMPASTAGAAAGSGSGASGVSAGGEQAATASAARQGARAVRTKARIQVSGQVVERDGVAAVKPQRVGRERVQSGLAGGARDRGHQQALRGLG